MRVGVTCLVAGVAALLVGIAGTAGSLALAREAVKTSVLDLEQTRTAVSASTSLAYWFTFLGLALSPLLLVAGLGGLGFALARRLVAERAARSRTSSQARLGDSSD